MFFEEWNDNENPKKKSEKRELGKDRWVLWRKCFSEKCFSKSGMTMRNPKKSEKRELGKDRWDSQMRQVGTGWSTWDRWDRDRQGGLNIAWDRMGLGQGGLQIRWDRMGMGQGGSSD